jgi:hypothetical protein
MLTTILDNLQERGHWGNNKYRGNCSGKVPKQLIEFFSPKNVADYMCGSGTVKDVCEELRVNNQVFDLNPHWGGFDLVNDEIPSSSDFIFFHPPYNHKDGGIILYSGNIWGNIPDPRDLSQMNWENYLKALNICIAKQYLSLRKGGRLAMLIGDCRKKGKLYSAIMDCIKPGEIEHIIIKKQENCTSNSSTYSGKLIPIVHEWLMIFKKTDHYLIGGRQTVFFEKNIKTSKYTTWRDVVHSAMEALGGKATLQDLYKEVQHHFKTKSNPNWQAKVRQVLQLCKDFTNLDRGIWAFSY